MKKHSLLLALPLLALTSCTTILEPQSIEREDDEDIVLPTPSTSKTDDSNNSNSDGSSEEEAQPKTASTLTKEEYKDFPIYYLQKLNSYESYKAVTVGSTVSVGVTQTIDATVIKGEYSYYYNASNGVVNSSHTAYYHNNQAVYQNLGDSDWTVKAIKDYLNIYGTYPFSNAIEGCSVKSDAIKSVTKLDSEENHVFKIVFNPSKATTNMKIQMKEFGGLKDLPTFNSIDLTITVKDDFTPITIDLNSEYKALKMILPTTCTQHYVVTFSNFNESIEIPGLDAVKGKFSD